MAGRARTIKPEWLDDEALIACSLAARVLTIGLIVLADDYGNGRSGRTWLAARVFPGLTPETLDSALAELTAIEFCSLYQIGGQHYFTIRNWDTHQRIDHPSQPKVPGPESEGAIRVTSGTYADSSRESRETKRESCEPSRDPHARAAAAPARASHSSLVPSGASSGSDLSEPKDLTGSARVARSRRPLADVAEPMTKSWTPDAEQISALATRFGVDPARIANELPEFRWYWLSGKGAGKRKTGRGWSQTFANRIEMTAKNESLFAAPRANSNGAPASRASAQVARFRELAIEQERAELEAENQ